MERRLEEKMEAIMRKPGVVGAICVDKRGLPLSGENSPSRSPSPLEWGDSSSSSSDQEVMAGSPKKNTRKPEQDQILSSSVKTAGYNIVFQVLIRIFTFTLNAFILRYVSHEVLGICNVRLALLHSSVIFLSREPFRRASLRKNGESDSWPQTINLIWLTLPVTCLWSGVFCYLWCYTLTPPTNPGIAQQYRESVWLMGLSLGVDAFTEVPYIVAQYFSFSKLRIIGDTTLILVRSLFLCFYVIFWPSHAIWGYAVGTFFSVIFTTLLYWGYFFYKLTYLKGEKEKSDLKLAFTSLTDFLPNPRANFPWELGSLSFSFFKQGILKQLLTEGERYLMTIFDILAFDEQGVYDLVSNLGSLAARFIFLPVEESAYFYFAQTLERRATFNRARDKNLALSTALILGNLFKLMLLIGLIMLVYGIPYSNTLLFLYGGPTLSQSGPGTLLLQFNCAYIFTMALNGVTEAFTFAAMTQPQLDSFNRRLVIFSLVFLAAAYVFTGLFGSVGFFLANSLNMGLRVGQSVLIIRGVFLYCDEVNPFTYWKLEGKLLLYFLAAGVLINLFTIFIYINRLVHVIFGLVIFAGNLLAIYYYDGELIWFFVRMFKSKKLD